MRFEIYFPCVAESCSQMERLVRALGCIEHVENAFDLEFSCGDGKFLSDLEEAELEKYDGRVCFTSLPRHADTKKLFKANHAYVFECCIDNRKCIIKNVLNNKIKTIEDHYE